MLSKVNPYNKTIILKAISRYKYILAKHKYLATLIIPGEQKTQRFQSSITVSKWRCAAIAIKLE